MTLDEVKALSDEELWMQSALFAGWTGLMLAEPDVLYGHRRESDTIETPDKLRLVPNYPHDFAAAKELFELIPMPCGIERGYEEEYGVGPIGVFVGFGELPLDPDEDDVYAENVWAPTVPLAITRAFLLAMDGEHGGD